MTFPHVPGGVSRTRTRDGAPRLPVAKLHVHRLSLALAALAMTSCITSSPAGRVWSVRQVIENQDALDGRVITVRGWVRYCERLGCALYDSRAEERLDRDPDRGPGPGDPYGLGFHLSIGGYPWFDEQAHLNAPSYVVMVAKVDGRCMNDPKEGIIAACTDRPDTLVPIRILRWGK